MRSEVTSPTVPFGVVRFQASELAAALGARLVGPDATIDGASFDSRTAAPGQLFAPIVAERDGHEFIADAVANGACAYLTAREPLDGVDAAALCVRDTLDALLDAGRWGRGRLADGLVGVVGVTGSVGKTSTKDLAYAAVGTIRRVAANERSFNNHLGLPVTILNAPDDVEVLINEIGMNDFGEIAKLCTVARPTIGIVTSVGEAHSGPLGGIDGVAKAKRELVEALPADGVAILNADDARVDAMASATDATIVRYGTSSAADIWISDIELDDVARPRFRLETPWGSADVELAVSGAHMAMNAAAAVAAAGVLDVAFDDAVAGVSSGTLTARRMQLERTRAGALVINDSYNANPVSMAAALRALAAVNATRRFAVLGLMAELDEPASAHRGIADLAAELGIELVPVGTDLYGVSPVADPVATLGALGGGDAVLVKASLVAGFDRIVAAIHDASSAKGSPSSS